MAISVANRTESKLVTAGTSFTINFTQTSGDRVVIIFGINELAAQAISTISDSFVDISNANQPIHVLEKIALDGSEGGTCVVTFAANVKAAAVAYNIQGSHASSACELSTRADGAEGSGGTPDSGNLTPSWGSAENLWITVFQENGEELDDDTWVTATPTNYSNTLQITSDTGGSSTTNCQVGSAERILTASSEDPGAFTTAQDRAWKAYTVAVRPAAAGGGGDTFFENRHPIEQGMKPWTAAGMGGVISE